MQGTSQSIWEKPPPYDPIGESRSREIDRWLFNERIKDVSQTLIVSPEGPSFDALRSRVMDVLGSEIKLLDGRVSSVNAECFNKQDKKRMRAMEPSVMVFLVALEEGLSESELLTRMTKIMANFLFVSRHLGLSENCIVIIIISHYQTLKNYAQDDSRNSEWLSLFPKLLQHNTSLKEAIVEEFEAMAEHGSKPLQVKVYFDECDFGDLNFLRREVQEAHDTVLKALKVRVGLEAEPSAQVGNTRNSEHPSRIELNDAAMPWDTLMTAAQNILENFHILGLS